MGQTEPLKTRAEKRREKRHARALKERRKALSPVRIFLMVMSIPLLVSAITVSIYIRTSPWPRDLAIAHLAAIAGCSVAEKLGVAPASRGEPGYHSRHDPDGDGVACGEGAATARPRPTNQTGGAKFLRP